MSINPIGMTQSQCLLEVCVDNIAGLENAIEGGADRIELCSSLELGGVTPSVGFMEIAAKISPVPVNALIRPRSGDFSYSPMEQDVIESDILHARDAGLAGVVIGASLPEMRLDVVLMKRLIAAANGMDCTLHRAFDLVPDFPAALEQAIDLGFSRILTSGGASCAEDGLEVLKRLCQLGKGRISIMPGGGVSALNAQRFLALSGVRELHGSCSGSVDVGDPKILALGFASARSKRTDVAKVRALRAAIDTAAVV